MWKETINSLFYNFFLLLFVIGGLGTFLTGNKSFSAEENRSLHTFSNIDKLSELEEIITDQFPGRNSWLAVSSQTRLLLGEKEINDTYIGKEGYLFDACTEEDFPEERYEKNLSYLNMFASNYKLSPIFVPVPSPCTISPEKLPPHAPVYDAGTKYSLAKKVLGQGRVRMVDTRTLLQEMKSDIQVYYRTDHHWTSRAAARVFQTLYPNHNKESCSWAGLTDSFYGTMHSRVLLPGIRPDTIEAIESDRLEAEGIYHRQALASKDKYAYFLGGNKARLDLKGKGKGSLLLIKDSYANCMVPFLLKEYARIIIIDLRYYNEPTAALMKENFDQVLILYEMTNFALDNNIYKLAIKM